VTRWIERDLDTVHPKGFAVVKDLGRLREPIPVPQLHEGQRLRGRDDCLVTRSRVVRMRMGNQSSVDRPRRINVKAAGPTTQARRCRGK
jgi:hypothetical protein